MKHLPIHDQIQDKVNEENMRSLGYRYSVTPLHGSRVKFERWFKRFPYKWASRSDVLVFDHETQRGLHVG